MNCGRKKSTNSSDFLRTLLFDTLMHLCYMLDTWGAPVVFLGCVWGVLAGCGCNTRFIVMLMYLLSAQEADVAMCRCEGGVELALQYAKLWCRYAKDLLTWIDKRISLGESLLYFLFCTDHHLHHALPLAMFVCFLFNLYLTSPRFNYTAYHLTLDPFNTLSVTLLSACYQRCWLFTFNSL